MVRTTHKYGIELPKPGKDTIEHARKLDRKNGNTLYMTTLQKEMGDLMIAFEMKNSGEKAPPGWHKATGQVIWDVKMDFMRKARWVKEGHKTPNPTRTNYLGVILQDSIQIALTYAALMGLPVMVLILKMPTFRHRVWRNILSYVAQSLALRMKGRWL